MTDSRGNIFITGCSHGIGYALAKRLLASGYRVFGISRTEPMNLNQESNFQWAAVDLSDLSSAKKKIEAFLSRTLVGRHLDYVFLNAGRFGDRIDSVHHTPLTELMDVMNLNLWANKVVLDSVLDKVAAVDKVVFSASIAGVRARAGNGGYAISKAALNMLAKLYSLEYPNVHFAVLGLCNVYTRLSRTILTLPLLQPFSEQLALRKRAVLPGVVVTAEERAEHIISLLPRINEMTRSGDFVEIRSLLSLDITDSDKRMSK